MSDSDGRVLSPIEMDVQHIRDTYGENLDSETIHQIRLAGAVASTAANMFELLVDGYVDMCLCDGDLCVVGLSGPVRLSEIITVVMKDPDTSVFFDRIYEGDEDAEDQGY